MAKNTGLWYREVVVVTTGSFVEDWCFSGGGDCDFCDCNDKQKSEFVGNGGDKRHDRPRFMFWVLSIHHHVAEFMAVAVFGVGDDEVVIFVVVAVVVVVVAAAAAGTVVIVGLSSSNAIWAKYTESPKHVMTPVHKQEEQEWSTDDDDDEVEVDTGFINVVVLSVSLPLDTIWFEIDVYTLSS